MPVMKVLLQPNERAALLTLAQRERRDPRAQAALIIRRELERLRLMSPDPPPEQAESRPEEDAYVEVES
jgi:hypothetical protein